MLIAGDIGGTKTDLALYVPEEGSRKPVFEAEYHSADYPGLEEMVREFIDKAGGKSGGKAGRTVEAACFDVAGPVIDGRAHLTNLPWVVEAAVLKDKLGLKRVSLLNDLKAVGYAIPHLLPEDLHGINAGTKDPTGAIAVIAPGTGLGEAFLVWDGAKYVASASEGGHGDFGPCDAIQAEMWGFLAKRFGHVAYERVCSGSGLPNIYDFLRDSGRVAESAELTAALAKAKDRTPPIMQAAMRDAPDPLCAATLDIFVRVLAAETGNLALKVMATGGVYLAGGIPPRILPRLDDGAFMQAFANKGRLSDVLQRMPVQVVMNRAALIGAAQYGLDEAKAAG